MDGYYGTSSSSCLKVKVDSAYLDCLLENQKQLSAPDIGQDSKLEKFNNRRMS